VSDPVSHSDPNHSQTGHRTGAGSAGTNPADPWAGLPATGAWQPEQSAGRRQFALLGEGAPLTLEAGAALGPVTVAYETWGRRNASGSNAVLVLHALTGDSHLVGPTGPGHPAPGWWDGLIGPDRPLDPGRWWVICPNVLGGCAGTTGPASPGPGGRPWGSRFPMLTVRDQVAAEIALADALEIERWAAVIGGSMGGMRALEWAVGQPERVERAVIVATGAAATAEQIALTAIQAQAIRLDPGWAGGDYYDAPDGAGPARGLGLARRLGQVSYRSEPELAARFGRRAQDGETPLAAHLELGARPAAGGDRYAVESYLDHHARKLAARFDANSYLVLSRAMDHHDIGRGRGGVAAALARVEAEVTVAGVDSDRLYPLYLQEELVAGLRRRPELKVITSLSGHDGFLVEVDQIAAIVASALA
jgi:homoserine O-acetyltransferase/O-succinyltransferase